MPAQRQPKRPLRQAMSAVLLTSLVTTAGLAIARQIGGFQASELDAYDQFVRLQGSADIDDRILVVGIGETDIQNRQEFPLEDGTLADTLETLERYNPRVVGVDIGRDVPQGPPEGRTRLIEQLESSDNTVTACVLSSVDEPGVPAAPGTDPDLIGFADLPIDVDNVVRRSILVSAPAPTVDTGNSHLCNDANAENEVLSLSLLLSLIYLESENIFPEQTIWGDLQIGQTVFTPLFDKTGGYASTGATDYQVMLNYRAPEDAVRQVSLSEVLAETVPREWIEDRIVLIGYTSSIAKDIFTTPYAETTAGSRTMPGVVVHAQATSQILSAVLEGRPLIHSWPELAEIVWVWLWALLGGLLAFYLRRIGWFTVGTLTLLTACWGLHFGAFSQGLWLPLVPTMVAVVVSAIATRLLDQADQSGYAQAVYEQLKDQLRGQAHTGPNVDYLEALVQRARAIRQQRTGSELLAEDSLAESSETPDQVLFDSPEKQAVYDQIKARAYADLESERSEMEASKHEHKRQLQERRIQSLILKARQTRSGTVPVRQLGESPGGGSA